MKRYVFLSILNLFFVVTTSLAANSKAPKLLVAQVPSLGSGNQINANPQQGVSVKSYKEWKQQMIVEAESRLNLAKDSYFKRKAASSQDPNVIVKKTSLEAVTSAQLNDIQKMINREQLQLSLAQDLTISDYFVGYLTKQKSLNHVIKQVSTKLSPDEVAELMTAYADHFFSSAPQGVKMNTRSGQQQP